MMKKILVSGCAGFIASHLAEKLLEEYKVVGIDNLSLGKKENIYHLRSNPNFTFHVCEILNPKELENIFRIHSFDSIFHLAACSDISKGIPLHDLQNTFATTYALLEKCRIRGIKEFLFTSSGAVYGETNEAVKENYGPLLPISHYGAAKLASEAFISSYSSMYGIKSWLLRLPNVVGERMTHGAIFDFKNQIKNGAKELHVLGDGSQTKPYMYVKDLIDAMIFIYKNANEQINYFNIAGKGRTSVKEIAEMFGVPVNYSGGDRGWVGDSPQYDCDISKLKVLGWVPKRNSIEAVKKTIHGKD